MTALSYSTSGRDSGVMDLITLPIAAEKVLAGSLACINTAGYACKGANTAGFLPAGGYFSEEKDNSAGSAGDLSAHIVCPDKLKVATSGAAQTSIGKTVYLTDDNTVQFAVGHVPFGICVDYISATEIWVAPFRFQPSVNGSEWSMHYPLALTTANATVTMIPAWFNTDTNGLIIKEFYAVVKTALAGGDQDQATIDLYDSADGDLSAQIDFADAGADAVGDLREGHFWQDVAEASALKKVTTGRSVYAKVTQAVSGAGAAGAVVLFIKAHKW